MRFGICNILRFFFFAEHYNSLFYLIFCVFRHVSMMEQNNKSLLPNNTDCKGNESHSSNSSNSMSESAKKQHIKKPLNAFMLYMKEMRAKVVAECTLKESAAINQILGRRVC